MAIVVTNLGVYLAIAEEAVSASLHILEAGRIPKPDGQPGYVNTFDRERKSFKQSLIAIAFSGMHLEALLGLVGVERLGKALYNKIDRQTTYEEKLSLLGIYDPTVLANCKRFRETRNDLIHEKAAQIETLKARDIRIAQTEAAFGVGFVKSIGATLHLRSRSSNDARKKTRERPSDNLL